MHNSRHSRKRPSSFPRTRALQRTERPSRINKARLFSPSLTRNYWRSTARVLHRSLRDDTNTEKLLNFVKNKTCRKLAANAAETRRQSPELAGNCCKLLETAANQRQKTAENGRMAKIEQFEFPEIPLTETIDLARRIFEDLGGEVRRDGLAIVLGMSPTGGAFGARISALRLWGLATGRSLIRLTPDGVQVFSTNSATEEAALIRKLAAAVPLFNELHQRIGESSVDQSVFAVTLQEITDAEMNDVVRRVAVVERIFAGIQGLLNESPDEEPDTTLKDQSSTETPETAELPPGWIEFRYDDGALRMRETLENLDVLIGTLETRRNRLMDRDFTDNP